MINTIIRKAAVRTCSFAICFVAALNFSSVGYACMKSPEGVYKTPKQVLSAANGIYYVSLRSAQKVDPLPISLKTGENITDIQQVVSLLRLDLQKTMVYNFDVTEVLLGKSMPSIQILLPFRITDTFDEDFNAHASKGIFWSSTKSGRGVVSADCSLISSFDFEHKYLLIVSDQWTTKSFEIIQNRDDAWFQLALKYSANQEANNKK